ncbi:hypothetical protein, partial [Lacticaseibacillus brantae]|uniref:hypothetical protein n=1 Tax=Lacticaseibacillus brantae TaxID=943673 RepID=UPI001F2B42CC
SVFKGLLCQATTLTIYHRKTSLSTFNFSTLGADFFKRQLKHFNNFQKRRQPFSENQFNATQKPARSKSPSRFK